MNPLAYRCLLFLLFWGGWNLKAQPIPYALENRIETLKILERSGSVLYLAAHPDDENNGLLAWLHHDQHLRTAYLSLTRGEGGQNLIGEEQGREIGLIRTQELLEARKIDGAEQYFTRAYDFGFSKNPEETLRIWQRDSILSDMVYVIRSFHPDVIICRFPTTGEGGHGHHTASAILAEEAIRLAADPAYPHCQLPAFACTRLLWNAFFTNPTTPADTSFFKLSTGGYNALLGKSYGELAAESRSKHECQAMGTAADRNEHSEYFKILRGDRTPTLFGNQIVGWKKWNAEEIEVQFHSLLNPSNYENPHALVPKLIALAESIEQHPDIDPVWKQYASDKINALLLGCSGMYLHARCAQMQVSPNDTLDIELEVCLRSPLECKLLQWLSGNWKLSAGEYAAEGVSRKWTLRLPVSNWNPSFSGTLPASMVNNHLYAGQHSSEYTRPQNAPIFFQLETELHGKIFRFGVPLQHGSLSKRYGEQIAPLLFHPPASADFKYPVSFAVSGKTAQASVQLHTGPAINTLQLQLHFPKHWKQKPLQRTFNQLKKDEYVPVTFEFPLPPEAQSGDTLSLSWIVGKDTFYRSSKLIRYPHIPGGMHTQAAQCRLILLKEQPKQRIGYVPGSGDKIPKLLSEMGYRIQTIQGNVWNADSLQHLDAIITGIRAYNTNTELIRSNALLMEYVRKGGLLIQQYNTDYGLLLQQPGPLPFKLSTRRVTEEDRPVEILAQSGKWKQEPEKFFDSWIQERGLYFPIESDTAYQRLFRMSDTGSPSEENALLYLPYGKGEYYYCSLSLFRQLPAGVPSAFNLLQTMLRRDPKK